MAHQSHSPERRRKLEEILENEAQVRNQKARTQEFGENERLRKERKTVGKKRVGVTTPPKKREGELRNILVKKVGTVEEVVA
eukprot:8232672-Karenia_brevis.AAC.1